MITIPLERDKLIRAEVVASPTISTSLGVVYCSLRRELADRSFEEILGQPDAMFISTSDPDLRHYVWDTKEVSAELTIWKSSSRTSAVVESGYVIQWQVKSKFPELRLSCRVGFAEIDSHTFSYHDSTGDQAHQGAIWTNEDFVSERAPKVSVVAIAGWFDREVEFISDHWGVYSDYREEHPANIFAVASGSVGRSAQFPEPELAEALFLDESQLFEIERAVDPLG